MLVPQQASLHQAVRGALRPHAHQRYRQAAAAAQAQQAVPVPQQAPLLQAVRAACRQRARQWPRSAATAAQALRLQRVSD